MKSAGQKQMARLLAKEGNGLGGTDGGAHHRPDVPLMPLGRSTATTGAGWAFIASIIDRAAALDRPIEAGTEQRIDDDVCAPSSPPGSAGCDRPLPFFCRERGIALQPV